MAARYVFPSASVLRKCYQDKMAAECYLGEQTSASIVDQLAGRTVVMFDIPVAIAWTGFITKISETMPPSAAIIFQMHEDDLVAKMTRACCECAEKK